MPDSANDEAALSDVRIADFTRVVAGPYATMLLGDLGADVIKVEQPTSGDDCRRWGPPFVGGESTYFLSVNRNKRSVEIDLGAPSGRRLARDLALECGVVVESFRPGTMERFGLDYETLKIDRPDLIYCSITGYGSSGPYRSRAGYDVMVSAHAGLMAVTGHPGCPPVKTGVALTDVITGLYAAQAITTALYHRERTGQGQLVEVSLLSSQLAALINVASAYLVAGHVTQPQGSGHESIVPYQAFKAKDDWVVIGAANDSMFARLVSTLGHPEWADDPRYADNAARVAHRERLTAAIEQALGARTAAEWEHLLSQAGVAVARVNRIDEVFADPQVVHSGQVVTVPHPAAGPIKLVGPAIRMSATPPTVRRPPPTLGQHNEELAHLATRSRQPSTRR